MQKNSRHAHFSALLGVLFFLTPFFAFAQEFTNYAIQGILGRDGILGVEEHFTFDFGKEGSHGVMREIPLWTGGAKPSPITFHMISVSDKEGIPYKHDASSGGNVALVRIGDKDVVLSGSHYYDLRYTLSGVATDHELKWQIITPVKETMGRFQADLYFTMPVPVITSTSSCAFVPNRFNNVCRVQQLIKDDKLYGYRVSAEHLSKEGIVLSVKYPKGLITPPLVATRDTPKEFPKYLWYLGYGTLFFVLLALVLWYERAHIMKWREERKKPVVLPDTYSYLARAVAQAGHIAPKDIIATTTDLVARGYLTLTPIANPVGEFEFIDYAIEVSTDEFPVGSEGALLDDIRTRGGIRSLDTWLRDVSNGQAATIEAAAKMEVEGVILLHSDEQLPDLPGFRSERFL